MYPETTSKQKQPSTGALTKSVMKICSKFTGEHPCRHGCSPVNLLHIFITLFVRAPVEGCFCLEVVSGYMRTDNSFQKWSIDKQMLYKTIVFNFYLLKFWSVELNFWLKEVCHQHVDFSNQLQDHLNKEVKFIDKYKVLG